MKIFSSFDTQLKDQYYQEFVSQYGEENVLVVRRGNLYFYIKVVLRIIYGLLIQGLILVAISLLLGKSSLTTYGGITSLIFGLPLYIVALSNYIDYIMDYAIFTPDEAIFIEQVSIFHREIKSLDVAKIKSITIQKKNLFFSLFNSGLLTIISEGNEKLGEIILNYVYDPELVKKNIHNIILQNERIKNKQTND